MANGNPDDEELRLKVVYEASQVVKDAIADIRALKEATGELNKEQEETLKTLEYQKTLLDGVGSALDQETQALNEATQAQRAVRQAIEETEQAEQTLIARQEELEEVTRRNSIAIEELAGKEEEEKGFKGLAGNALKAEKAMASLAGGSGLGRVGPMLESVTKAIGGPEGLGLALGGLAFGVGVLLPKLAALWTAFEDGPKDVRDAEEAIRRFDDAVKAHDDRLLKRSLAKVDKEIEELEMKQEKERDVGQKLAPEDAKRLKELRRRSAEGHEELEVGQELRKIGPTKQKRAIGQAVAEAMAESGGVEGMIGTDPDIVARRIVANALKGDVQSVETLKRWSPEFAAQYQPLSPEGKAQAKAAAKKEKQDEKAYAHDVGVSQRVSDQMEREEEAQKKKDDDLARSYDEWAIREQNAADNKAKRDHDKAMHAKAQHDKQTARERTPQAILHAQAQREEGEALGAVQQNTYGFGADQQKAIAKHLRESYQQGYGFAHTFEEILGDAIRQSNEEMQKGALARLKRQYSGGEMR